MVSDKTNSLDLSLFYSDYYYGLNTRFCWPLNGIQEIHNFNLKYDFQALFEQ